MTQYITAKLADETTHEQASGYRHVNVSSKLTIFGSKRLYVKKEPCVCMRERELVYVRTACSTRISTLVLLMMSLKYALEQSRLWRILCHNNNHNKTILYVISTKKLFYSLVSLIISFNRIE